LLEDVLRKTRVGKKGYEEGRKYVLDRGYPRWTSWARSPGAPPKKTFEDRVFEGGL